MKTVATRSESKHPLSAAHQRRTHGEEVPPKTPWVYDSLRPPRFERQKLALPVLQKLRGSILGSPGSTLTHALDRLRVGQLVASYVLEELRRQLPFGVSFMDWDAAHGHNVDHRDRELLISKALEACGELPRRGGWCVSSGVRQ